jgi:hypothetical protein
LKKASFTAPESCRGACADRDSYQAVWEYVNGRPLRVAAGAGARIAPRRGTQIGVVIDGSGHAGGHELSRQAAFSLERGEGVAISADSELELLLVGLPIFAESERRQLAAAGTVIEPGMRDEMPAGVHLGGRRR